MMNGLRLPRRPEESLASLGRDDPRQKRAGAGEGEEGK
jgi:hypothetical protein